MIDHITLLRCHDSLILAKRIERDGEGLRVTPYDQTASYAWSQRQVNGIDDIHAVLADIAKDPHTCVIRGDPMPHVKPDDIVNRRANAGIDGTGPDWQEARPGRLWVAFDFDNAELPDLQCRLEDWGATAADCLRSRLPYQFRDARAVFKLSSSAGLNGLDRVSMHLWFWVDRPVCNMSWRAWMKAQNLDASFFTAVQPHYTADPVFVGADDPFKGRRMGVLVGAEVVTAPPELMDLAEWEAEQDRQRALKPKPERVNVDDGKRRSAQEKYAIKALQSAIDEIQSAGEGGRHDAAFRQAHAIGGYVGAGVLDWRLARESLTDAICSVVPASRHAKEAASVAEGVEIGVTKPRDISNIGRGSSRPRLALAPEPGEHEGHVPPFDESDPWARVKALKAAAEAAKAAGPQTARAKKEMAIAIARATREALQATGKVPLFVGVSDDGRVPESGENLRALFDFYGFTLKRNAMLRDTEIEVPESMGGAALGQNGMLAAIRCRAYDQGMTVGRRFEAELELLEKQNVYHPVADWIRSIAWDGVDRFEDLWRTITIREEAVEHTDVYRAMLHAWLATAAKMALLPLDATKSIEACGVLVLQGRQGCGKTKWLSQLVPSECDFIATGVHLDPGSKDSVDAATRYWIVELGEIDSTLRKADVAMLKAFLTNSRDQYRSSYERKVERHTRRTCFAASVNEVNFLKDTTGNRRFWTLPVESMGWRPDDAFRIGDIDRQQLWAQFATLADDRDSHTLSRAHEAALGRLNEGHRQIDPLEDEIRSRFELTEPGRSRLGMLTPDIYHALYPNKDLDKWTQAEKNAVGRALLAFGAESWVSRQGRRYSVAKR